MSGALILVAEDEVPTLRIIRLALVRSGYEVITATDGKAALDLARERKPDLILADILMPKLSGLDLLKLLKRDPETFRIPLILLTSLSRYEDSKLGYELGAENFLNKPFTLESLLRAVRKALGEPAPPRAPRPER